MSPRRAVSGWGGRETDRAEREIPKYVNIEWRDDAEECVGLN